MTAALFTRERKRQRPATVEERLEGWACRARKPRSEKNGLPASHRRSRLPPFTDSILAITRICASPPQVAATSLERCSCKRSRLAWLCRLAQSCQPSSKESQNRTANEQDGRRWTEKKFNRYLCSSSASICSSSVVKNSPTKLTRHSVATTGHDPGKGTTDDHSFCEERVHRMTGFDERISTRRCLAPFGKLCPHPCFLDRIHGFVRVH